MLNNLVSLLTVTRKNVSDEVQNFHSKHDLNYQIWFYI